MSKSKSIKSSTNSTPGGGSEAGETNAAPVKRETQDKTESYRVAGFDLALKHFAVRGEHWSEEGVQPLIFELVNFELKSVNRELLMTIVEYLDRFDWSEYDCVVIEGQIAFIRGFGGAAIANAKIQQILETYFYCRYPQVEVVIIPSKAKYPKGVSGQTDAKRKKWAIERMTTIFESRGDTESLKVMEEAERLRKKKIDPNSKADDLADACLLIIAHLRKLKNFPFQVEELGGSADE